MKSMEIMKIRKIFRGKETIEILLWNVRGIKGKIKELQVNCDKCDVMVIVETKLKDRDQVKFQDR